MLVGRWRCICMDESFDYIVWLHFAILILLRGWNGTVGTIKYVSIIVLFQRIRSLVSSDKVRQVDKLRLVMLYAVRYESHSNNDLSGLVEALRRCGVAEEFRGVSVCLSLYF